MKTTSPLARSLRTISLLAIALVAAVIMPSAAMAIPTTPIAKDAYVVTGGTGITVWWSPSTDGAAPILYDLYRSTVPMTLATATADKLILTTSDTTVTVTPAANEATDKFTYFYAVVARNASTGTKSISANVSPNVHGGGWRTGFNVNNCTLCHSVHGVGTERYLGSATRYKCYRCHGNTTASTNYGAKAIRNVQRDFYDYAADQTIPATVSRHYNGQNITDQTECTMCHTPHKSPHYVDAAGVYQPTLSYTQLLRAQRADLTYAYSTDSLPLGNNFCFECHGTSTTTLDYNAGTGAYARAGGDHQTPYAAPATAAHNATVVLTNTTATNPAIQCEACHNKHAAAAGGLADWRSQGTTDPTVNNQAGLCFQCHKTNSAESTYLSGTRISGSSAPYSWRGTSLVADIYDQFKNAARKSTHPLSAGSGRWVATSGTVFSQDTKAEFDTDTLFQTVTNTADGDGSVVLNTFDTLTPIPPERFMFYQRSASMVVDAYEYDTGAAGTWNTPYNPTDETSFNTATGSNLFAAGGNIYRTRGGGSTTLPMIRQFTLGTDTNGAWGNTALTTTFNTAFGTGAAVAVNEAGTVAYLSAGGSSNVINWWDYPANSENSMTFSGGTLGVGSGIAYTPDADRLWVILRNGTTGAGTLWRLAAPGVKFGAQTFTDTGVVAGPSGTTQYYSRMTYFEDSAGTDYLASMGRDATARFFHVMSGLAGTPTRLRLTGATKEPSGGGTLADGCSLQWDGVPGGYIYATLGGTSTVIKRIRIPADPTIDGGATGWGTWETLTNPLPAAAGVGADITFAMVDRPGSVTAPNYYADGTVTTGDITAPAGAVGWGTLTWNGVQNAPTTTLSVTLEYSTDNWATKTTHTSVPSGTDLAVLGVPLTAKVHLIGNLHTGDVIGSTPQLDDWTITTLKETFIPAGSLTCYNCHNTHAVEKGAAGVAWDLSRVSNPDDIQSNFDDVGTTVGGFCLKCHDGTAPTDGANSPTTFVPYSVGFRSFDAVASPFFFGRGLWNKSAAGAAWTGSAHDSAGAIAKDCGTCHDPHSSNFSRLTAYTGGTTVRANTDAAVSKEENLCYAANGCHNSAATTRNVQTPMAATYSHTAENVADKHSDTEGTAGLGLGDLTNRHSECADCHDPHAAKAGIHTVAAPFSSSPGGALLGAGGIKPSVWPTPAYNGTTGQVWETVNAPTSWAAERMNGDGGDFEAYVCFKCHSAYSDATLPHSVTNGTHTYQATDVAMEFNPSNYSYHNVLGQNVTPSGDDSTTLRSFTTVAANGTTYTTDWWFPTVNVFVAGSGYDNNSMLTCTSCHTNETAGQARGPHGSSAAWIIDPAYATDWKASYLSTADADGMNGTPICQKCHDLYNTAWSNDAHAQGNHQNSAGNGACNLCHIKIPHGWKRPRLLGYATDDSRYSTSANGLAGVKADTGHTLTTGQANWIDTDCYTVGGCNTGSHPAMTTGWK